jgi:nucleoside-diphosphate kinase
MERTLVLIKPDAMQRGLAGEIIVRLERRGLRIVAMRMLHMDEALARQHYAAHEGKAFFPGLLQYITSSPIIAAVFEGKNAVEIARQSMGATNPAQAAPGTIRGDLGRSACSSRRGRCSATSATSTPGCSSRALLDAHHRRGLPVQAFQIVEVALVGAEDVDDDVAKIQEHPARRRRSLAAVGGDAILGQLGVDGIAEGLHLANGLGAGDHEVVGEQNDLADIQQEDILSLPIGEEIDDSASEGCPFQMASYFTQG